LRPPPRLFLRQPLLKIGGEKRDPVPGMSWVTPHMVVELAGMLQKKDPYWTCIRVEPENPLYPPPPRPVMNTSKNVSKVILITHNT